MGPKTFYRFVPRFWLWNLLSVTNATAVAVAVSCSAPLVERQELRFHSVEPQILMFASPQASRGLLLWIIGPFVTSNAARLQT